MIRAKTATNRRGSARASSQATMRATNAATRDAIALAALPFVSLSAPPEEVVAALLAVLNDADQASAMQALDIAPQSIAQTLEMAHAARRPLQRALYLAIDQDPDGERALWVRVLADDLSDSFFERDYCQLLVTQTHLQTEYVLSKANEHGMRVTTNPRQVDAQALLSRVSGAYAELRNADWSLSERKKLQPCVMMRPETWPSNFRNRTTGQFMQVKLGVYHRDAAAIPAMHAALLHCNMWDYNTRHVRIRPCDITIQLCDSTHWCFSTPQIRKPPERSTQ